MLKIPEPLLGRYPQELARGSLEGQTLETEIQWGVPATLLSNRPDVMASEYGLIQAFELTNVARSRYYPSLPVYGDRGLTKLWNWTSYWKPIRCLPTLLVG